MKIASGLLIDDAIEIIGAGGAENTEDVVELVEVVLAREDGAVGEHLGQDAAHGPDVDGLRVALGVEHDLGGPVPPGGHVLGEEACVVMFRICNSCETKVTDLEVTGGVQEKVAGLEVTMEDIG